MFLKRYDNSSWSSVVLAHDPYKHYLSSSPGDLVCHVAGYEVSRTFIGVVVSRVKGTVLVLFDQDPDLFDERKFTMKSLSLGMNVITGPLKVSKIELLCS